MFVAMFTKVIHRRKSAHFAVLAVKSFLNWKTKGKRRKEKYWEITSGVRKGRSAEGSVGIFSFKYNLWRKERNEKMGM